MPATSLFNVDNRSDHEYIYPAQHDFTWKRPAREAQRKGKFPHISIEDKVFVETVGGDLTIKVEDNTETGRGIYSEEVEDKDQTLDDSEIYYAVIGNNVLLGLKNEIELSDVFSVYGYENRSFHAQALELLSDAVFTDDFKKTL